MNNPFESDLDQLRRKMNQLESKASSNDWTIINGTGLLSTEDLVQELKNRGYTVTLVRE
jgi:hypothetical protein